MKNYFNHEIATSMESKTVISYFRRPITIKEIKQMIPLDGTRCHHDYDCCGNWYASQAKVIRLDDCIIVKQDWSINI